LEYKINALNNPKDKSELDNNNKKSESGKIISVLFMTQGNQDICNYLYDFGITPRKSMTLKLKYINWDVLRGIIDGDGCVREQNYGRTITIEISSGSKIFLEQIQQFLKEHEIKSYLRTIKGNKDNDKHVLSIYKSNNVLKIYDCLYQNAHFFLNRKKLKFKINTP